MSSRTEKKIMEKFLEMESTSLPFQTPGGFENALERIRGSHPGVKSKDILLEKRVTGWSEDWHVPRTRRTETLTQKRDYVKGVWNSSPMDTHFRLRVKN